MKKMIVFMLSVLMIFSLAACGSQDGGSRTSATQSENDGGASEETVREWVESLSLE